MMCGNMRTIADEGVLLLNCGLTVQEGIANSHNDRWEPFTRGFLKRLMTIKKIPMIAMGARSQLLAEKIKYPDVEKILHPGQAAIQKVEWTPFKNSKKKNFFDVMSEKLERKVEW